MMPEGWMIDREGKPLTDPRRANEGFLLPIGGYKGYGLALVVDLFAGLLSGAAYLTHVQSWSENPEKPQDLGHFFIAIDTSKLGSAAWIGERMNDFAQILHSTPAIDEEKPVLVPGQIELERLDRQRRDGLEIDDAVLKELKALSSR